MAGWAARSWTASSGSHLTLSCNGCPSRLDKANIFPPTLNTDTSSPNGNSSWARGTDTRLTAATIGAAAWRSVIRGALSGLARGAVAVQGAAVGAGGGGGAVAVEPQGPAPPVHDDLVVEGAHGDQ